MERQSDKGQRLLFACGQALPSSDCLSCVAARRGLSSLRPAEPVCVVPGSYFARDAAYSHHYSKSDTHVQMMFLARVLVGDFVRGNPSLVRPPAKEGQSNAFYDSCVNSVSDPGIFVVFEKHQAYPEYLIQYSTSPKLPPTTATPTSTPTPTPSGSSVVLAALGSLFGGRQ